MQVRDDFVLALNNLDPCGAWFTTLMNRVGLSLNCLRNLSMRQVVFTVGGGVCKR